MRLAMEEKKGDNEEMKNEPKRFVYRFNHFEKAFFLLEEAIKVENPNSLEVEGMIQRFEYTYELAWKSLADYLNEEGINLEEKTPRTVIKKAFEAGLIKDGHAWIKMLEERNKTSHTYLEEAIKTVSKDIRDVYYSLFKELYLWLKQKV